MKASGEQRAVGPHTSVPSLSHSLGGISSSGRQLPIPPQHLGKVFGGLVGPGSHGSAPQAPVGFPETGS
jgi:hypothetical protein